MSLSVKSALAYHRQMADKPELVERHQVPDREPAQVDASLVSRIGTLRKRFLERMRS